MTRIRFFGAAGQVTGSCALVQAGHESLLVDCGLFQGSHATYQQNYDPFPFDIGSIDHVILTHAHADHSGRLPLLVKRGFSGAIHCHHGTRDLAEIIILDSAHIQEVEAGWRSRKNQRKGLERLEPLYTVGDAERTVPLLAPHGYHEPVKLSDRFSFVLKDAGHILGSSILELSIANDDGGETLLVFTGDLGRKNQPIIRDPETVTRADFLVIESTYGGRHHPDIETTKRQLASILQEAARDNGNVIIPSFAVGRTQELLYYLRELCDAGEIPENYRHIYVDSPMATRATEVYERAEHECYDDKSRALRTARISPVNFPGLRFVGTAEESMLLNMKSSGQIIISASGMCDAGRILHHLRHNLWNPKSHIVFVGYQAAGTKGRKLMDGQPVIKVMREEVAVRAKIHSIDALSAHADHEGLVEWAATINPPPKLTMVVHGEPEQSAALKEALGAALGHRATVPAPGEEIYLTG